MKKKKKEAQYTDICEIASKSLLPSLLATSTKRDYYKIMIYFNFLRYFLQLNQDYDKTDSSFIHGYIAFNRLIVCHSLAHFYTFHYFAYFFIFCITCLQNQRKIFKDMFC